MLGLRIKVIMKNFVKGFISFGRLSPANTKVKDSPNYDSLDKHLNKIKSNITKNFNKKKSLRNEETKHYLQCKKT